MSAERHSGPFFCSGCGGVWINKSDLDKISEFSFITRENVDLCRIEPDQDLITGLCPNGHGIMIRAKVHLEPDFYLEKCSSCGGIWFDQGKLKYIIENNLNENLNVIWTFAWQRMQRKKKDREYYHKLNKKLLGDDIYNSLIELARKLKDHPHQLRALALLRNGKDIDLRRKGKAAPERYSGPFLCCGCSSVQVTSNDLDKISEFLSIAYENIDFSRIEPDMDSIMGLCSNGHEIMIRAKVHLKPDFYLEKCSFDHEELNPIIENNLNENLSVIWSFAWQRMQRDKKGREYYHKVNKELLGDDIYNSVIELARKLKDHPHQLRALSLLSHEL